MGYYIYAWLEKGNPQLQIVDVATRSVCFSWGYQETVQTKTHDRKEIQRLFKDLLLLTCKQELNNYRIFEVKPESGQLKNSSMIETLLHSN